MSITSARNFIEKSGCGVIFAIVIAAVMALGMFAQCSRAEGVQGASGSTTPADESALVKVGASNITPSMVDAVFNESKKNREEQIRAQLGEKASTFEGFDSTQEAVMFRDAFGQLVDSAINLDLATEAGIQLSDDVVVGEYMKQFETQVSQFRDQMTQSGQLKAGATEAEFLEKFKQLTGGKAPADILSERRTDLVAKVKDPTLAIALKGGSAQSLWAANEEARAKISDAELDTIFDTVILKSIVLKQAPRQNRTPEAEKILTEIKSGSITFEAAMDKYSEIPPAKGKTKKSENEDILAWQFLLTDENYGVVKSLKPGEISGVIKGVDGPIIYKLLRVKKDNKPADYASKKEFYRQNHAKFLANTKYYRLLREKRAAVTGFASKGYEELFRLYTLDRDPIVSQDFLTIVENAEKVTDAVGKRPAIMAKFFATNRMLKGLAPAAKSKFEDEHYIPAIEDFLTLGENPMLRMMLVDLYITRKSPKAAEHLLQASVGNTSLADAGMAMHQKIYSKLDELKKLNLIKPEIAAQVETNQQRWKKDRKTQDDAIAAQKKRDEEDRKRNEELIKKEKEAAAKANAGKPAGTTGPSSTDLVNPPATGPTGR